jgi:hypothetical protein
MPLFGALATSMDTSYFGKNYFRGCWWGISWVVIHSISVTVSHENTKNLAWIVRKKYCLSFQNTFQRFTVKIPKCYLLPLIFRPPPPSRPSDPPSNLPQKWDLCTVSTLWLDVNSVHYVNVCYLYLHFLDTSSYSMHIYIELTSIYLSLQIWFVRTHIKAMLTNFNEPWSTKNGQTSNWAQCPVNGTDENV